MGKKRTRIVFSSMELHDTRILPRKGGKYKQYWDEWVIFID